MDESLVGSLKLLSINIVQVGQKEGMNKEEGWFQRVEGLKNMLSTG
jgi:hypothetical protein